MILIPSYNCEDYIADTIESAINQTLKVPVYLIDNCSTDKTIEIAKKYPISIIQNEKNIGRIGNWNRCLEIAKEESKNSFFTMLFAGDRLKPNAMKEYSKIFSNNDVKLIVSKYEVHSDTGISQILPQHSIKNQPINFEQNIDLNLFYGCWENSPSVQCYHIDVANEFKFDDSFTWASDWKFVLNVSKKYDIYFVDKILSEFHTEHRKVFDKDMNKLYMIAEDLFLSNWLLSHKPNTKLEKLIRRRYATRLITTSESIRIVLSKIKSCIKKMIK